MQNPSNPTAAQNVGQPSRLPTSHRTTLDWVAQVEPWPQPVDAAALLAELSALTRRFIVLPKWADTTLALWTLHTYAFPLRDVSTYLGIESPEKRCGKTTLLTVLSELVNRPIVAANISSPAFFRVIEETQPTLLIDEADTLLQGNDELRGILNSGYTRKTAFVVRVASQGVDYQAAGSSSGSGSPLREANSVHVVPFSSSSEERAGEMSRPGPPSSLAHRPSSSQSTFDSRPSTRLARFSSWCPKVMAAIGRLPETLADRCIVLRMQRKTAREDCERLRHLDATTLRRQCARFVLDHSAAIAAARPAIPPGLNDRAADIWEPLFVLADLAGGTWPELARQAAEGLTATAQENNPIGSLLLDILITFTVTGVDRIFSRTLASELNGFDHRPWAEARNGKEINELWLAKQLRPYGIRPKTMWIGDQAAKGYLQEDFSEVFPRYIPRSEIEDLKAQVRPDKPPTANAAAEAPPQG